jgi:2-oxo-3-hexenedioate decarboxylase
VRERRRSRGSPRSSPTSRSRTATPIQDLLAARRIARGESVVGAKLGLTSRAKQVQMKCSEPVYGRLFSDNFHPANEPFEVASLIHPRVEPEIVFVMKDRLAGPGVSAADVIAATSAVCCGLEIIDSRYDDFSFTAADVVADNTSEAKLVMGPKMVDPTGLDLGLIGLLLEVDGEQVATACGAATMGHPPRPSRCSPTSSAHAARRSRPAGRSSAVASRPRCR